MASKEGPHWKANLHCGTGATGPSSCSFSSRVWWPEAKEDKSKPAGRPRKPKRTSFACLECSRTFPTQQAMAGHCSAHTRAGARRVPARTSHLPAAAPVAVVAAPANPLPQMPPQHHHHHVNAFQYWCPQVQVINPMPAMPPLAVRYVPCARPVVSNQMMVRLPYLDLHGRRSSRRRLATTTSPTPNPAFRPVPGTMPNVPASGRLGWRAFLPIYSVPPCTVNAAPPPGDAVSSTDGPAVHARPADLTLRLGSSGRDNAKKRPLPLLESLAASDAQQSANRKCKLVITDGGDRGSKRGNDRMDGLDLELRLYR